MMVCWETVPMKHCTLNDGLSGPMFRLLIPRSMVVCRGKCFGCGDIVKWWFAQVTVPADYHQYLSEIDILPGDDLNCTPVSSNLTKNCVCVRLCTFFIMFSAAVLVF